LVEDLAGIKSGESVLPEIKSLILIEKLFESTILIVFRWKLFKNELL